MHAGFKNQQLEEEPRGYGSSPDGTTSIETTSSGGTGQGVRGADETVRVHKVGPAQCN